ncbi:MAG: hypothetical protein HRU15_13100 [Planctomycetes bacterium]|nr:hypothetical protein [Planctomycetota bacterium]
MATRRSSSRRDVAENVAEDGVENRSRRGGKSSRRAPAEEATEGSRRTQRGNKSSRSTAPVAESDEGSRRGRNTGGSSGKTGRVSARDGSSRNAGSSRGGSASRRLSPAEEAQKKKKIKNMLTNIAVLAVIGLMVLIGIAMMPNPNLEIASREMNKAVDLFAGMKEAFENESLSSVELNNAELMAILQTPLFAMGTDDTTYYDDKLFSDIYYSSQAKEIMDEAKGIMKQLPDAQNRKLALSNVQRLRGRIGNIDAEEDLNILSADIAAYKANPVDPESPDTMMESKYGTFMQKIVGYEKTIAEEQAIRNKRSAEEQAQVLAAAQAAKAKKDAEEAARRKEQIAKSRDSMRATQEAAKDPTVVAAEKEAKRLKEMSNETIMREIIAFVKEYKYTTALKATDNFKKKDGADPAVLKTKVEELIEKNFEEMQVETSEMRNDARKLFQQEKHGPARKLIQSAVVILETVKENCGEMEDKKKTTAELLEMAYAWRDRIGG